MAAAVSISNLFAAWHHARSARWLDTYHERIHLLPHEDWPYLRRLNVKAGLPPRSVLPNITAKLQQGLHLILVVAAIGLAVLSTFG